MIRGQLLSLHMDILRCALVLCVLTAARATEPSSHTLLDSSRDNTGSSLPARVIFDHDGGVDDFITLMLLLSQPSKVEILGITIVEGDCIADIAVNSTVKLLHLLGHQHIPVALSTLKAANPFPDRYRAQGLSIDVLPMLNHHALSDIEALKRRLLVQQPGQEYFLKLLLQQEEPVTLVMTGPLSNLAYALDKHPEAASKVARVWWMGGALHVPGNVVEPQSDGSAEWNAFWDPAAVGVVWNSSVPLTLVPLDATNKVPITPDLLYSFGPQAAYTYSALAGTLYAPVVSWVFNTPTASDPYFAWDVLTAACMLDGSELCQIEHELYVAAVLAGPGQGATVLVDSASQQQKQQEPSGTRQLTAASPNAEVHGRVQGQVQSQVQQASAGMQEEFQALLQEGLSFDVQGASAEQRIAAAAALAAAPAARGSSGEILVSSSSSNSDSSASSFNGGHLHFQSGVLLDVSKHLSEVKRVSAVTNVDPKEFKRYLLTAFRQ